MDYNKIGGLITAERKAKKLTQAKLAEKIFVSEKTVSKWETGRGIPDTNVLPKLCEIFDISLNEFLNGERVTCENKQQNDKLLLDMARELEIKNNTIWRSMWVIISVSIIALTIGIIGVGLLMPKGIFQIVLVFALCIVFLIPCFYALKLEVSVGVYKCKKCGCEIIPTYAEAVWSLHKGTTRFLKCPNCKKRTWCRKKLKK